MCFRKRNEIRYNRKARHYGVVKKRQRKKTTSVFMSTEEYDSKKKNIPMYKNINKNSNDPAYFIKRVRTYENGSYSGKIKEYKLSKQDKKLSDSIYKEHLKNKRLAKKRKKKNQHHS